jgi:hypothetical protein
MSSTSAGGLGTLGKLPGEIRNRIYQFYFEDAEIAKIDQLWIDSHRMDNKSAGFIGGYKTCKPNKKVPSIWKKFFPRELLLCSKAILAEAKLSSKSTNYNLRLQYHLKGRHKARKAMTLPPEFLCKATTKLILSAISADEFGEEYHRFSLPAHKFPRLTAIHFDSLAHNLRPIEISDPSFPEGVHKGEFDAKLIEGGQSPLSSGERRGTRCDTLRDCLETSSPQSPHTATTSLLVVRPKRCVHGQDRPAVLLVEVLRSW